MRIVLVGTGTGIGKTHVACALLRFWSARNRVVGLKPIETGVAAEERRARAGGRASSALSDQERLAGAAGMFHVKHVPSRDLSRRESDPALFHVKQSRTAQREPLPSRRTSTQREHAVPGPSSKASSSRPTRALFAFPDPVSPHLAARDAGVRIDLGIIERWVGDHEAPITVIETAGALFSPIGHGTTNFDLTLALRPDVVVLVAPDRLGVLHDLTATMALAAARGGPELGIVLSAPSKKDTSTGRNAAEVEGLGLGRIVAEFPRADERAASTQTAAQRVGAWIAVTMPGSSLA